jgi:K+-sensing histidine kinase KdpD
MDLFVISSETNALELSYNEAVWRQWQQRRDFRYLAVLGSIAAATTLLKISAAHINPTTVALALLLVVLFVATAWGPKPAIFAALLGVLCFNFFFLPPLHTLTIADPHNWIALVAFLITATTVGQLSARAKMRAEEADAARKEIERLYLELQESFERASQAKALEQSEKLKTALLDAVTHDLRTPLTSIKASITTLLDDARVRSGDDQDIRLEAESRLEMLEIIDEETDRLNRFIDGLIELARIEAGELHLRRRWGNADEIIATALKRAEPFTQNRNVEVEIEPELPVVRVDERAVSEVIYTLVDNAVKYSPPGSEIIVSANRSNGEITMVVEDKGSGIPVSLRKRVFDKFFRATRDGDISTRKPSGTGMGLAIAKGIVEAHGGKIWIESGAGGLGTRVNFTLPIGDEDSVAAEEFQPQVAGHAK